MVANDMTKIVSLREVTKYISRGISPRYVENDGIVVLNQKCIRSNKIHLQHIRLTDRNKKIASEKLIKKYDVLINSTGIGTLGRIAQVKCDLDATVDSHVTILRINNCENNLKIDPLYIGYALQFQEKYIETLGKGATGQTELAKDSILDDISILLPSYEKQKKISSILATYDELIENNEKRIKLLEEMAQRLYTDWFVKFRFPGYENVKMVDTETEYGAIPDGWKVRKLTEVVDINPRESIKSNSSICHVPMEALSTSSSIIDVEKIQHRSEKSGTKFKNEDTLFARITPCLENGKTGLVQFLKEGEIACGSTEFVVLRSKELNPIYIFSLS